MGSYLHHAMRNKPAQRKDAMSWTQGGTGIKALMKEREICTTALVPKGNVRYYHTHNSLVQQRCVQTPPSSTSPAPEPSRLSRNSLSRTSSHAALTQLSRKLSRNSQLSLFMNPRKLTLLLPSSALTTLSIPFNVEWMKCGPVICLCHSLPIATLR